MARTFAPFKTNHHHLAQSGETVWLVSFFGLMLSRPSLIIVRSSSLLLLLQLLVTYGKGHTPPHAHTPFTIFAGHKKIYDSSIQVCMYETRIETRQPDWKKKKTAKPSNYSFYKNEIKRFGYLLTTL